MVESEWYFILEQGGDRYLMGAYATRKEAEDTSELYGGGKSFQISEKQWKEIEESENIIRGNGHEE